METDQTVSNKFRSYSFVSWVGFDKLFPKKSPIILLILLFSDTEPIILSKVAHYSQIILNSKYIVCSIKLHAV